MTRFAASTLTVTLLTLAGIGLSFLSNLALAARFGVGVEMDVYLAATTLPNLLNAIMTASLAAVFLPVFLESRQEGKNQEWVLASTLLNGVALVSAGVSVLAMAFAVPLQRLLTPGLPADQIAFAADLMLWLLPGVVLVSMNQILSGVYFSRDRFFVPMAIRLTGPGLTLLFILAFGSRFSIRGLAAVNLAAIACQTLILAAARPRPSGFRTVLRLRHPAVIKAARLLLPMILISCCLKVTPVFERWVASEMPTGSISTLGYATRLINILQPVVISGISVAGFALMSGLVARKDMAGLRHALGRNCGALLFASIPLAAFLCVFGKSLIALALERGNFTPENTEETFRLFALYALALPATTVGTVLGQGFYTFQDTRTPTVIGVLEVFLYAGLCKALLPVLGLAALPVSFCVYFYLSAATLTWLLSRKAGFSILPLFLKPAGSSLVSTVAALAAGISLRLLAPDSRGWGAVCFAVSCAAYLFAQKVFFRSEEASRLLGITKNIFLKVSRK
jgi:putative peptidoglycan lipid II flippase